MREVLVAVRLELVPAEATDLGVWKGEEEKQNASLLKNCNLQSESRQGLLVGLRVREMRGTRSLLFFVCSRF